MSKYSSPLTKTEQQNAARLLFVAKYLFWDGASRTSEGKRAYDATYIASLLKHTDTAVAEMLKAGIENGTHAFKADLATNNITLLTLLSSTLYPALENLLIKTRGKAPSMLAPAEQSPHLLLTTMMNLLTLSGSTLAPNMEDPSAVMNDVASAIQYLKKKEASLAPAQAPHKTALEMMNDLEAAIDADTARRTPAQSKAHETKTPPRKKKPSSSKPTGQTLPRLPSWYEDQHINALLHARIAEEKLSSDAGINILGSISPLIKGLTTEYNPLEEAKTSWNITVIPVNTSTETIKLNKHGSTSTHAGIHWTGLVVIPNIAPEGAEILVLNSQNESIDSTRVALDSRGNPIDTTLRITYLDPSSGDLIHPTQHRIMYMDSLGKPIDPTLRQILETTFPESTLENVTEGKRYQTNGYDCGVFVVENTITVLHHTLKKEPLTLITQTQATQARAAHNTLWQVNTGIDSFLKNNSANGKSSSSHRAKPPIGPFTTSIQPLGETASRHH